MAKKITPATSVKSKVAVAKPTTAPEAFTTPVRNTTVPPKSVVATASPTKKSPPTYDAIAIRAFTIWQTTGGNEHDNWIRAERELSGL